MSQSTAPPAERELLKFAFAVIKLTDELTESDLATKHLTEPLFAMCVRERRRYSSMNNVTRPDDAAAAVIVLTALHAIITHVTDRGSAAEDAQLLVMTPALHALDGLGPELLRMVGEPVAPAPRPHALLQAIDKGWVLLEDRLGRARASSQDEEREALELLGLEPGAPWDDVKQAYRSLAKRLHPDRHHDGAVDIEGITARMARVNEAHAHLKRAYEARAWEPASTSQADEAKTGQGRSQTTKQSRTARRSTNRASRRPRPPRANECAFCGHRPAADLHFTRVSGFLLWHRVGRIENSLCRSCGWSLGADVLNRTLMTGWWGVMSFFQNLGAVVTNVSSIRRAKRLDKPRGPSERVDVPLRTPMPEPRPYYTRVGTWVAAGLLAFLGLTVVEVASESDTGGPTVRPDPAIEQEAEFDPRDMIGSCILLTSSGAFDEFVDCSIPHDVRIIDVTTSESRCPSRAEYVLEADASFTGQWDTLCLTAD